MAAGFVSQHALANELNRRRIPAVRGGKWHRTSIRRVLIRVGLITSGHGNNGRAINRAADVRAVALGPIIHKLRKAGFSSKAILSRIHPANLAGFGRCAPPVYGSEGSEFESLRARHSFAANSISTSSEAALINSGASAQKPPSSHGKPARLMLAELRRRCRSRYSARTRAPSV